ncbi:unnamed protein product [Ilex paraguariensis]|uniref:Response regulatory domain-containing protein n=1 Tax=Ilex paraguariensis TaxID=185542 RepID=A0ABC8TNI6_9AQUA
MGDGLAKSHHDCPQHARNTTHVILDKESFCCFHGNGEVPFPLRCLTPSTEVEVDLIITDYRMPGMTGYDLLRKIKECSSLRDIPVVIMSSENIPSRINRCLEQGAEEFFLKPVQQADVNKLRPHLLKERLRNNKSKLIEECLGSRPIKKENFQ